ncbi:hypothetical protein ACIBCU_13345 [Streptomyces sp. NPDC051064]|uniref:hypothetical protein n=1 Tax=Streptomyces sp. NPDC051064 TaxID=3365641 RepID=UPI0037A94458
MTIRGTAKALSSIAVVAAIGLCAMPGTAHAGVVYQSRTLSGESLTDAGSARWAEAHLIADDSSLYGAKFNPDGEVLTAWDRMADGHANRIEMIVYKGFYYDSAFVADRDTIYVASADGNKTHNLGSPDGSGDIPEDRGVEFRVCVNETSQCSDWVRAVS